MMYQITRVEVDAKSQKHVETQTYQVTEEAIKSVQEENLVWNQVGDMSIVMDVKNDCITYFLITKIVETGE